MIGISRDILLKMSLGIRDLEFHQSYYIMLLRIITLYGNEVKESAVTNTTYTVTFFLHETRTIIIIISRK